MLGTIFSGFSNLISGNTSSVLSSLPTDRGAIAVGFANVSVMQTGYFTPTTTANHAFTVTTEKGAYLAVDGTVLVNTTSNGVVTSANLSLVAGRSYSIVYNTSVGTNNRINLNLNGGANTPITATQLKAPRNPISNPTVNPLSVVTTRLAPTKTPESVNPTANVLPTDIFANTQLGTVPFPAIGVSIANIQYAIANNFAASPVPVPYQPVTTKQQLLSLPYELSVGAALDSVNVMLGMPLPSGLTNSKLAQKLAQEYDGIQYSYKAQKVIITGLGFKPNTRLSIFFTKINVTSLCAPADYGAKSWMRSYTDQTIWPGLGAQGDPIITNSVGGFVAVFNMPGGTFPREAGARFDCFDYRSNSDAYDERTQNHSTYGMISFIIPPSTGIISTKGPSNPQSNTESGRAGSSNNFSVNPLCQTFYVGSDMTGGQDGVYINSVDLYFCGKSNTQPVTLDIRTVENNKPTTTILPYSRVSMESSNVAVSSNASSTVATNFAFTQPIYLRAGYTYALAVTPGGHTSDYSIWTGVTGKTDPVNGIVNSNWGSGSLYKSTTVSTTWTPIQNQFIKFKLYKSSYKPSGTATLTPGDYEFLSYFNQSNIPFKVGEFVYQQPVALPAIVSVNTSSNTLTVNATATGNLATSYPNPLSEFNVNDHIVVCGSFPSTDTTNRRRFNFNLFANAVTLKVVSVLGSNLTFAYANGAAITGAPFSNGACHIFKAQPGHLLYDTTSRSITGTGTRFDLKQTAGLPGIPTSRPLVVHTGNSSHGFAEVLFAQTVTNATSITTFNSPITTIPTGSQAIPLDAPVGRVVAVDPTRNLIILDKSTANTTTGLDSSSNAYASPSFFAPGRTLIGSTSGATAIIDGIHDVFVNKLYPYFESTEVPGTSLSYTANATTSNYASQDYPIFQPKKMNYFTNTEIIISSRSNEIFRLSGAKSFKINATLTSNSGGLTPTIDLNNGSLQTFRNLINDSPQNEHTKNGTALAKYVSKVVTLSDGNDAEDLNVYLTAYKPVGTNLVVYAKLLSSDDSNIFEDKDWSILRQVTDPTLYSDIENPNDFREYQYTLPTNPVTIPFADLITTNNSTVIVSTAANTKWQSLFVNNQFVTLYSDVYGSIHQVNRIASVDSNTQITLTSAVNLANTSSAIIASMPFPYSAYKNTNNANIVRYYTADGNSHDSFKKYAIKVVMTSHKSYLVPRIQDIRTLALSV